MSSTLTIEINAEKSAAFVEYVRTRIPEGLTSWMSDVASLAERFMTEEAPIKAGQLQQSVVKIRTGKFSFNVYPTAPHAIYVEKGTRPHRIEGKPVLSWFDPKTGMRIFARYVKHPGTKPNPFVSRARKRLKQVALPMLRERLLDLIREKAS